jgi:elongation factor P
MNNENFEQICINEKLINRPHLLKEGQEVEVVLHQESAQVLACELPPFVELKVSYTEPGVKGDSVTRALKPAILETGFQVQVPLFIDNNDILKIDTRESVYVERIKHS